MAIDRLISRNQRLRVAWYSSAIPVEGRKAFESRGFSLDPVPCAIAQFADPRFIGGLAALVIENIPAGFNELRSLLDDVAQLLDADCRVVIRLPATSLAFVRKAIERSNLPAVFVGDVTPCPLPAFFVCTLEFNWDRIANHVLEHQPGPIPNGDLQLSPIGESNAPDDELAPLFRRAFSDCGVVHLREIRDGRSQAGVYKAYPVRVNADLGPPIHVPYFVKVGPRKMILREYSNYLDRVDAYIPFHLGPQLVLQRCCLGAKAGLIVGDFVDDSERLAECARSGRAGAAISCLFNRTLAGWHHGSESRDEQNWSASSSSTMGEFPRASDKAGMERRVLLASQLTSSDLLDLRELERLFNTYRPSPVRVGPIHGDLHAGNVFVRSGDAVLIDFAAHRKAQPLLFDAASLEVSLLVDGFDDTDWPASTDRAHATGIIAGSSFDHTTRWIETLKPLYESDPFVGLYAQPSPENPYCWFYSCVRQIRAYARHFQLDSRQYAVALSRSLLFKATKDLDLTGLGDHRRAAAYAFGERMLKAVLGSAPVQVPG